MARARGMLHHGDGLGWTRGIDIEADDTAAPGKHELSAGVAATRVLVADDAGALSLLNRRADGVEHRREGARNLALRFAGVVRQHPLPFAIAGAAALGLFAWRRHR
ncbi:MAG TPA: hypothetical protein VEX18_14725 [Polyangiaceae bacterium]|nr:hypothetical protein [Polyangiaceae bacterium]